jgi:Tfp pilus assembly protein PilF
MSENTKNQLIEFAKDEFKIVRLAAGSSLSAYDMSIFTDQERTLVQGCMKEYEASMVTRMDDWASHYNLGIFYQNQDKVEKALKSYETAIQVYPEALPALVNSSIVYSAKGNQYQAEKNLAKAVEVDPQNEAALLNLGLLLAEQQRYDSARTTLKKLLEINPESPVAAYNLSVMVSKEDTKAAIKYIRMAIAAAPQEPKYSYTYSFYLYQDKQAKKAIQNLQELIKKQPNYYDAVVFLGSIYEETGQNGNAESLYKSYLKKEIPPQFRTYLQSKLNQVGRQNL